MPVPPAVRIRRDGVEYLSNVERAKYLIRELTRAALRDSGKLIRNRALNEVRKLKGFRRGKRPLRAFQTWVKAREGVLVVGIKHDTWYGVQQELGTSKQPKRAILTNAVMNNISDIRRIQGVYLSSIEDENRALGLIDEDDEGVGDEQ
ncbi:HK97-gp10 family putative phage morphogenesis protein [Cohnella lupini]|uniref:HK97 gp10 family phage protein n=1 Tax=Cohnella lupini TaxID=1294267 RepID=A0A3D9HZ75_9BACL|nr:HK97-gp10 family putative phage morphogenesis protein [Cohnella lupini]RED54794.1 HK97 gp10 family phage protein [Cohnella lupini]